MKEKKNIIDQHKKLLVILKKHNINYFINDNPKISDSDYDKIKSDILKLEKQYPYLEK